MTAAPQSAKETLRLAKLHEFGILDTLPEETYDDITTLAAQICQTPTALVSLIDANRQWFKSKVGIEASETPRSIAFCAHTIQQSDLFIVEDTHNHPQFRDNPLVTGSPHIRFYAGAPLITADGYALGSLCIIDYQPRQISAEQKRALRVLSHQVVAQMELTYQSQALKDANDYLEQRVKERTAGLTSSLYRLLKTQATLLKKETVARQNTLQDPLTGLPNHSYFLQRLDQAIQLNHRQPSHQYAVLFIDLDNFRPINESLSPEVGDRLLSHIAEQITLALRKSDLVARLGGDEFAILLDDIHSREQAITVVERLQKQLRNPFEIGHHKIFVGASLGITFSTLGYRHPEAALKDARTAMYQAKKQNQQRLQEQLKAQRKQHKKPNTSPILIQDEVAVSAQQYVIFNAGMQNRKQARLTLGEELRNAISQSQLQLYYQPIFNLSSRQLYGFEALLRWQHPTRGCLPAKDFINIAEDIGMIRQLCSQTIQHACQQQAHWRTEWQTKWQTNGQQNQRDFSAQNTNTQNSDTQNLDNQIEEKEASDTWEAPQAPIFHINLSLMQMRYPQLILQWQSALKKHQLSASSFQIEISEQVLLSGDSTITTALQRLKELGFKLCVDDFGKGHSSLSRLHQLGINSLKIDRAFINELDHKDGTDITKTIIDFGKSSNMEVMAGGIETPEQMKTLISLGCQKGQGFWLAKPLPAADIEL
ncbi:MAG: EAL domain-containing protein [Cyanobacteria bacterium J06649_4]